MFVLFLFCFSLFVVVVVVFNLLLLGIFQLNSAEYSKTLTLVKENLKKKIVGSEIKDQICPGTQRVAILVLRFLQHGKLKNQIAT